MKTYAQNEATHSVMKTRHWLIAVALALILLAIPALIHGDGHAPFDATLKQPATSTIGAQVTPYAPTVAELKKLAAPHEPLRNAEPVWLEPAQTIKSEGPYPGMTPAEIAKLDLPPVKSGPSPFARKGQPASTVGTEPRAPGEVGLTPAERDKRDALARRDQ